MFTLYGVYRSRATRIVWLAKEMGLDYRHVPVVQRYKLNDVSAQSTLHTKSPEFLAINPNGHIPSIEDDGLVLHESLAITLYLARKHGGTLAPGNAREDGLMTMWTLWAATEAEPHSVTVLLQNRLPRAMRDEAGLAKAVEALRAPFAVLNAELSTKAWLVGDRFTVADLNVAEVIRYALAAPGLFEAAPHVKRWLEACHTRPAYIETMALREAEPE
jgi:glutathione S-transferase